MPIFVIDRNFAGQLEITPEVASGVNDINDREQVRWLFSFLSVDKKRTFCLYEAANADAIREAARQAGIPADAVVEVATEILPNGVTQDLQPARFA